MDTFKIFMMQSPMIAASIAFVIVALLKAGKEKGAILIVLGAIGICLLTISSPIVHGVVVPRILEDMDSSNMPQLFRVIGWVTNFCWAAALALVAIGTLLRVPAPQNYISNES